MKSKSPKTTKKTLESHKFKIGDLVMYAPHFHDPDGPWVMSGDMGIIIDMRQSEDYQVVKVSWLDQDLGCGDMATEILTKVDLDKIK